MNDWDGPDKKLGEIPPGMPEPPTGGAGGSKTFTEAADSVIKFLERCGDADIEAGFGFIFSSPDSKQAVAIKAGIAAAITTAATQFAPGNFVTTWNPELGRVAVGVTRAIEDPQEANPRVLVKWLHDLSQEWVRS